MITGGNKKNKKGGNLGIVAGGGKKNKKGGSALLLGGSCISVL